MTDGTGEDFVTLEGYKAVVRPGSASVSVATFDITLWSADVGPKTLQIALEDWPDIAGGSRVSWQKLEQRLRKLADDCAQAAR